METRRLFRGRHDMQETAGTFFPVDGTLSLRAVAVDRTRLPRLTLRADASAGLRSFAAPTRPGPA